MLDQLEKDLKEKFPDSEIKTWTPIEEFLGSDELYYLEFVQGNLKINVSMIQGHTTLRYGGRVIPDENFEDVQSAFDRMVEVASATPPDDKELIIMRALPWCGKSTRAKELLKPNGVIYSTDEYFYKIRKPELPDEYSFHPNFIADAHNWNQQRAHRAIEMGVAQIIIDNTNTIPQEPKVYVEYALPQGYKVRIEEPTSPQWKEIRELLLRKKANEQALKDWSFKLEKGSKETHGVPFWTIQKMMWRWHNNMTVEDILAAPELRRF